MAGSNARLFMPASPGQFVTTDAYEGGAVLGLDLKYTYPEVLSFTGSSTVTSALLVPADMRLVILGVSLEWQAVAAGNITMIFEATTAGNAAFPGDMTLGTYRQVLPISSVVGGAPAGSISHEGPDSLAIVTSVGDGTAAVYQAGILAPGGDSGNVIVYTAPILASAPC